MNGRTLTLTLAAAAILATSCGTLPFRALGVGEYRTPEGTVIQMDTAGSWTTDQIHRMLLDNGLDAKIGPTLTVKVQDVYPSQTATSTQQVGGVYSNFRATIYLKGVNSTFANTPDAIVGHEFGHAWTLYHLYIDRKADWSSYLSFRGLSGDARVDSTYAWSKTEMIADDYRLVMGSQRAKEQQPWYINPDITPPGSISGFREFFALTWAKQASATVVAPTPTSTPTPVPTSAPAPTASPTPSPTPVPSASVKTSASPSVSPSPAPAATSSTRLLGSVRVSPQSFNRATKVSVTLNAAAQLSVNVVDASGIVVRTLAATSYPSGSHDVGWDGTDGTGRRVPPGTYVIKLIASDATGRTDTAQVSVTAK